MCRMSILSYRIGVGYHPIAVSGCITLVSATLLIFAFSPLGLAEDSASFNPVAESADARTEAAEEGPSLPKVRFDLTDGTVEQVVRRVLKQMTLREKIGQLCQAGGAEERLDGAIGEQLRRGQLGSLFYTGNAEQTRLAKRIALEETRLGLPLLTPRDVIHGFRTVFPIPLGQAASWNPALIEKAAVVAANEAQAEGVNWTFAPMLDICRDARWGRIAESLGEDPMLASEIAVAMVRGYQQPFETPSGEIAYRGIAACAKHFAAYGLTEGGRDYNRVQIARSELHGVVLKPFRSVAEAGCATFMTSFNTINGVPGTGHQELIREVLKGRWGFDGLVVSDWTSVTEMIEHGYSANRRQAARQAVTAGLDMEMASTTFQEHLLSLVEQGLIEESIIDDAVQRVLTVKLHFASPGRRPSAGPSPPGPDPTTIARELAKQSCVLLKNEGKTLPIDSEGHRIAVIGPLADQARDQLGCWMLDGKEADTITPLAALRDALAGNTELTYCPGLESSLDTSTKGFAHAVSAASDADVALIFIGEGWRLSGEARCRANLDLPGAQAQLIDAVAKTRTPIVLVVLAGRPLTIGEQAEKAHAVLYAWHPGTHGGTAIADLLLGVDSPSGKLPVTFPKHVGQSPLYYNHPRTGRPALAGTQALIGSGRIDFPEEEKYRSHYLDVDPFPQYPFGFGLSYSQFDYGELELSAPELRAGQTLGIRCSLTNTGDWASDEVAQLYVRDVAAGLVRPVRELKGFRRVRLDPGESTILEFALSTDDLAYYDNSADLVLEPGEFRIGVGGDSSVPLSDSFRVLSTTTQSKAPSPAVR
ncbi:Periplasmic beta-glucosidase precursor [Planctomycetes bacterium MalM25]|nr:Periplasmic beta-glucosidase precursor [Planctomycetes bacterium MalM25]